MSRQGAWLRVEATVEGQAIEGYVSQELVRYVSESAFDVGPIVIEVDVPTVAEAFVELKRGEAKVDMSHVMAGPDAVMLLGDIHGYIIKDVWLHTSNSPAGSDGRISNILRDMYLVQQPATGTYATTFARTSGKPAAEHKRFITERVIAFARLWFVKGAYAATSVPPSMASGVFDDVHAKNDAFGSQKDKLEALVDDLLKELDGAVR